ncbi:MAG: VTT domain-containing protein [Desulfovibrio sp.]|jgi:uncharacterized membrane protein YdjX (TVP38/TMEM64 family)|nr:VTT domain-containing protein [Desulfovibrio sp.]
MVIVLPPPSGEDAPQDSGSVAARFARAGLFFALSVAAVVLLRFLNLDDILDEEWADLHLRGQGGAGILLFVALAAALSPLGFPRQALAALGGYAFGAVPGIAWCSLGLAGGCMCGFFYSRLLAHAALRRRFGQRIRKLDAFLSRGPFLMSMAIRCLPVGNNALTNIAAGLTSIPAHAFIAGSAVGYLPQTVIFSLIGSGVRVDPGARLSLAALLFVLASYLGYRVYRGCIRLSPLEEDEESPRGRR